MGRTPIWLYVGIYTGRAGYGKGAHDPEVCYPAQGWEIIGSWPLEISVGDSATLLIRQLEVHLGIHRETVLYWFQPSERWPSGAAAEQLLQILDAVAGRPQHAFVRLSGPSGATAVRDLAEFAAGIAPAIRSAVEQIGSGNSQDNRPGETARAGN